MKWTTEIPKISAYYWAKPKDPDDWLDCSPEIVYLYFDGKWSVARPGIPKYESVNNFTEWAGPIERVEDNSIIE